MDDADRQFIWVCENCGKKIEETDYLTLGAIIQRHKCVKVEKVSYGDFINFKEEK